MKNFFQRNLVVIQLIILFFYIFARVSTTLPALHAPRELADTKVYVNVSNRQILGENFLYVDRPFAFPLLLQIVDRDFESAAMIQLGLTLVAWSLLAFMISVSFRPIGLRLFSFVIILALSLVRHLAGWDFVMMTESFSISFFVLLICCGIWLLQGWRWDKVILLSIVAFIFAFTRDTNAYILAMFAGMTVLSVILRWAKPRALILAGIFLAIFFVNNLSADMSLRWTFPFINVVGKRILPYTALLQTFEACGMPVTPELLAQAGIFANGNDRAFLDDPALEGFRNWVMEDGKSCYMKWLVTNPVTSIGSVLREFDGLIYFEDVNKYFSRKYTDLLPSRLERLLYPVHLVTWIWMGLTLLALAALYKKAWRENSLWVAYIMLCLTIFPHLFITWHGDSMAVERHSLSVGLQISLTLWLFIFLALEKGAGYFQRS
ncbi:MAG: hypothetical protein JNM55_00155 [Anaerolineales bacterium]|nr:hypothetical protein [Anaerolineales bacterium]